MCFFFFPTELLKNKNGHRKKIRETARGNLIRRKKKKRKKFCLPLPPSLENGIKRNSKRMENKAKPYFPQKCPFQKAQSPHSSSRIPFSYNFVSVRCLTKLTRHFSILFSLILFVRFFFCLFFGLFTFCHFSFQPAIV